VTELNDAARVNLVTGAAVVAGPGASIPVIEALVVDLALMAESDSPIMRRLVRIQEASRFVAELVDVEIEQSSTRAVLTLKTDDVTDKKPDGIEKMRTERTDQPDGKSMWRVALGLKGHRVLVFKELQEAGPDRKVRVCIHLTDLGAPEKPEISDREEAVNVRVVANADGEPAAPNAPEPLELQDAKRAEAEARAAYESTKAPGEPTNFLPYWSSVKGWSVAELISAAQRTPEGRNVTSLRHLDPYSPAGMALETIIEHQQIERSRRVKA
jgi:hypothetical protein